MLNIITVLHIMTWGIFGLTYFSLGLFGLTYLSLSTNISFVRLFGRTYENSLWHCS